MRLRAAVQKFRPVALHHQQNDAFFTTGRGRLQDDGPVQRRRFEKLGVALPTDPMVPPDVARMLPRSIELPLHRALEPATVGQSSRLQGKRPGSDISTSALHTKD